jgi:type I restriction enzyme S subunit
LPGAEEIKQIAQSVDDLLTLQEHLMADVEGGMKKATSLRQAIFSYAFCGELVAQDAGDEPASELLDRIAAERATRTKKTKAIKTRKRAKPRKQMQLA